jgi:hypothetical protein
MRFQLFPLAFAFALAPYACRGAEAVAPAADAGDDEGTTVAISRDAARRDTAAPVDAKTAWNRMEPHDHRVFANMRLEIVYLGEEGAGGASSTFDAFVAWLLASGYWGILKQYGVGPGSVLGSVRVPTSSVIPATAVKNGLISDEDLAIAVRATLRVLSADAGAGLRRGSPEI